MKNKILLLILILLPITSYSNEKIKYDLPEPDLSDPASLSKASVYYQKRSQNDWLDVTLVTGGYFTIGTTAGLSTGAFDDRCQITYGHPYAMTSFPVFSIDGQWYRLDDYFNAAEVYPQKNGDTLFVELAAEKFALRFSLINQKDAPGISLQFSVTNPDSEPHDFGVGFVIDPALGKWGDGHVFFDGVFLRNSVAFPDSEIPESFKIWEKQVGAAGLGMAVSFPDARPDQAIFANWRDVHSETTPEFNPSPLGALYDLDLKFYWNEEEVAPAGELTHSLNIDLLEPDFNADAFLRWDMPGFFSITNNVLFPRKLKTTVEILNDGLNGSPASLTLATASILNSPESVLNFTLSAGSTFQPVGIESALIYEDRVVEIGFDLLMQGNTVEQLRRNIFVPATAVSSAGLVIQDDSVNVADFPEVELIFSLEIAETGQRILTLGQENVFLFENGNRIDDFMLGKAESGGSNLADVVFVLDVSGSMRNEIDAVRANLNEFTEALSANGFDFRIGVVTFSTTVDDVWDLTDDIAQIERNLAGIILWGGVEDSPSALYRASELSFRPGSRRTIIWITDEDYPETNYTKENVVDRMLAMGITVHGVGLNDLQTDWFNPIVLPTGGNFYDINGNFRDILLDVTNFRAQDIYSLKYNSAVESPNQLEIRLEVHYAGLGVIKDFSFESSEAPSLQKRLSFFPNPFNPEIKFLISGEDYQQGEVEIYNILGQRVRKFSLTQLQQGQTIVWNATNQIGSPVGTGAYVVRLLLKNAAGKTHQETARILYIK